MSQNVEVSSLDVSKMVNDSPGLLDVGVKTGETENRLEEKPFLERIEKFVKLASGAAKLVHGSEDSPSAYSFSIRKISPPLVKNKQIESVTETKSEPKNPEEENKNQNLKLLREEIKVLNEILQNATLEELCRYKAEIRVEFQRMRILLSKSEFGNSDNSKSEKESREQILRKKAVFQSLIALINSRINSRFYQEYACKIETEIIMPDFGQIDLTSSQGLARFRRLSRLISQERREYKRNIRSLLLSSRKVISGDGEKGGTKTQNSASIANEVQEENSPAPGSNQGEEKNISENDIVVQIGEQYEHLTYVRFYTLKLEELRRRNEPQLQALLYPDFDPVAQYKMERKLRDAPIREFYELSGLVKLVLAVLFVLNLTLGHVQRFLNRDNYSPQAGLGYVGHGHNLEASGLASTFKDGLVKYVIAAEEKLRQEREAQYSNERLGHSFDVILGIDNTLEQADNRLSDASNQSQYVEKEESDDNEDLESNDFRDRDTISFFRRIAGGSIDRNLKFIDSNGKSFILDLREANFLEISTDGKDLANWFSDFRKNPNATILTRIVFLRGDGKNFEVPVLIAHAGRGYPFNDLRDGNAPRIYLSSVDHPRPFAFQQVNSDKWFIPYEEFYARLVNGKTINEYLSSLGRNPTSDKMAFSPVPILAKAIGEQERIEDLVVLITCTEEAIKGNDKGWDGVSLSLFRLVR